VHDASGLDKRRDAFPAIDDLAGAVS
jgi:hypothetical protein